MTVLGKTAPGTPHKNKVVLNKIKVVFQRFPGTAGTDADRGVFAVAYKLKVDGKVVAIGTTATDGSVALDLPSGAKAVLEVFDTDYTLVVVKTLEALNTPKGQQRRLQLLGYELGEADGNPQAKTNNATQDFQADNAPLDTDGLIGNKTRNSLKTQFGE